MLADLRSIECDGEKWVVETSPVGTSWSVQGHLFEPNKILLKFQRGEDRLTKYEGSDFQLENATEDDLCERLRRLKGKVG